MQDRRLCSWPVRGAVVLAMAAVAIGWLRPPPRNTTLQPASDVAVGERYHVEVTGTLIRSWRACFPVMSSGTPATSCIS